MVHTDLLNTLLAMELCQAIDSCGCAPLILAAGGVVGFLAKDVVSTYMHQQFSSLLHCRSQILRSLGIEQLGQLGIGLGLGIKEYDLIFVIGTEEAWNSFISGDIKFASSAEAAASDGVTGDSIEGASIAAKGVWVYQITKKGLSVDASIKGTKIYPDKKLNTYEE